MKTLAVLSTAVLTLLAAGSAGAQTCNTFGTPFEVAYNQQIGTGADMVTMDLRVHRYTFKPRTNMTMCSIGYQSPAGAAASLSYKFVLRDLSAQQDTDLGTWPASAFPSSPPLTPTHQLLPTPVNLTAGKVYQLRRVASGYNHFGDLIGRVLTNQTFTPPISTPSIRLTGSKFYGNGGPIVDRYLPFIDFGIY